MTSRPPLLAVLLDERFAFPDWWTRPTYGEAGPDEARAWLRLRELDDATKEIDEGHVTCGLPDQNEEVA